MTERPAAFRRDWLRLARTPSVGAVTFRELMRRFGDPTLALEALPDLARRAGRMSVLTPRTATEAEDEIAAGEALGGRLLLACDPGFPGLLAALDPPPPLIWVLGNSRPLERTCVSVVGARAASALGLRFAGALASDLGEAGLTVVSGMAWLATSSVAPRTGFERGPWNAKRGPTAGESLTGEESKSASNSKSSTSASTSEPGETSLATNLS